MKANTALLLALTLIFGGQAFAEATLVMIDGKEGKKLIQAAEKAGRIKKCEKGKTCYPNTSWLITCKTVGDEVQNCEAALLDPNR